LLSGQCRQPGKPPQRLYDGKTNAACRSSDTADLLDDAMREWFESITRAESYDLRSGQVNESQTSKRLGATFAIALRMAETAFGKRSRILATFQHDNDGNP
jgi:hypothetical protein